MRGDKIHIAIAGVGNCASALVQGLAYYGNEFGETAPGLMRRTIGTYRPGDIDVVVAFDVDRRKVGFELGAAIFAEPNNALRFCDHVESRVVVKMGPVLDGVASHMLGGGAGAFNPASDEPVDVAAELRSAGAHILLCYLPVGAEAAVRHYAESCLEAGVALINCVPVFIASDPAWEQRFRRAGLPIIGDDVKSQFGATILHRQLARLLEDRGCSISKMYQLNVGGNTDFSNMLDRTRLQSKKISKTNAVRSQVSAAVDEGNVHIGPSDYVSWLADNKVAFVRIEAVGFGGAPIELDVRLSVEDSPNSAGVVIDAIRIAALSLDNGLAGSLDEACAYYMKSPPRQMDDGAARDALDRFITEIE